MDSPLMTSLVIDIDNELRKIAPEENALHDAIASSREVVDSGVASFVGIVLSSLPKIVGFIRGEVKK